MGIIVVSLTCTFSFIWQLSLRFMISLLVFIILEIFKFSHQLSLGFMMVLFGLLQLKFYSIIKAPHRYAV